MIPGKHLIKGKGCLPKSSVEDMSGGIFHSEECFEREEILKKNFLQLKGEACLDSCAIELCLMVPFARLALAPYL